MAAEAAEPALARRYAEAALAACAGEWVQVTGGAAACWLASPSWQVAVTTRSHRCSSWTSPNCPPSQVTVPGRTPRLLCWRTRRRHQVFGVRRNRDPREGVGRSRPRPFRCVLPRPASNQRPGRPRVSAPAGPGLRRAGPGSRRARRSGGGECVSRGRCPVRVVRGGVAAGSGVSGA